MTASHHLSYIVLWMQGDGLDRNAILISVCGTRYGKVDCLNYEWINIDQNCPSLTWSPQATFRPNWGKVIGSNLIMQNIKIKIINWVCRTHPKKQWAAEMTMTGSQLTRMAAHPKNWNKNILENLDSDYDYRTESSLLRTEQCHGYSFSFASWPPMIFVSPPPLTPQSEGRQMILE